MMIISSTGIGRINFFTLATKQATILEMKSFKFCIEDLFHLVLSGTSLYHLILENLSQGLNQNVRVGTSFNFRLRYQVKVWSGPAESSKLRPELFIKSWLPPPTYNHFTNLTNVKLFFLKASLREKEWAKVVHIMTDSQSF